MITIHEGSILELKVDAIVNAANSHLEHGGGIAAAIAKAAKGPQMPNPGTDERTWWSRDRTDDVGLAWLREQREHPLIPTGGAGWTSAGHLPYKGIVHAVGPVWGDGKYQERELLASAYARSLWVAHAHGCDSLGVPAISCGIFGFPPDLAAPIAIQSMQIAPFPVTFALTDDDVIKAFREALDASQ